MGMGMGERGERRGRGVYSEVTHTSISSAAISMSSASGGVVEPLVGDVVVPLVCGEASGNSFWSVGARRRSLAWRESFARGEWWCRTGGPEKKESGVWAWCVERGMNDSAVGRSWRTSMVGDMEQGFS